MLKSPLPIAQNNSEFNGKFAENTDLYLFSDVVYDAGASVLRMLEAIVGADKFHKILDIFTKLFAYRNVKYSDFVDVVEKVNN